MMDQVAIKVTVDGAMRRICQDPKASDFGYQKLLSLADVQKEERVKVFYFDDESDKVYVSSDADVAEAVRAQLLHESPPSKYFTIHIVTKEAPTQRTCRARRFCYRERSAEANDFDFDTAWEKMLSLLRMFSPMLPGARAVLESPKLEELKTSEEVKDLLKLIEGDLKAGAHPFVVLHKVKGSTEVKNLLKVLKEELPDLAGMMGEEDDESESVHLGVVCDGCNQNPIRGLRFKCRDCEDFDFCSGCRVENDHNKAHSFDTIQSPRFKFPGFGSVFSGPFECFPREAPQGQKGQESGGAGTASAGTAKAEPEPKDEAETPNPWNEKEEGNGQGERSTDDEYEVVSDGQGAPKVAEEGRYERELKILEEMGFANREKVLKLLQSMDGNLRNVLQALFSIEK